MKIRDDRGILITLRGEMSARARREWRRGWAKHFGFFVFVSVLLMIMSFVAATAAAEVMGLDQKRMERIPWLVFVIGAVGGVVLSGLFRDHLRPIHSSRTCGGCNYPLVKLSVERDGCRVCSECGAAWKVRP